MFVLKSIPRVLTACFALTLLSFNVNAQTELTHPRTTTETLNARGASLLENDVFLISEAEPAPRVALAKPSLLAPAMLRFNQMLMSAIDGRLGAPYVYGAQGPHVFDCSGFVWSVFREAGIPFERGSARGFWGSFLPAGEDERHQFGTLVFFNNLKHVGIVVDEHGFYHASTSEGVRYSPFNEYWSKRITGFRRVPMPAALLAE